MSQIVESTADIGRELRRLPSFLPTLDRPRRIRVERVRLGVRVVRTPAAAPNCNAHAERFVRSIKEECLDRIIPIGERHFQHVITEFVEHYHRERNHQGLDNRLIAGTPMTDRTGRVRCRRRLGGLLNFYERAA
ncbi:MAG: transposase [Acidobacteria bacterium]|nr:MAG: transposase [Acidobacteriota bacterium]